MLEALRLKNFKCFKTQTISLKPLTFLSGVNGMGKSTIIQSLLLLRQSQDKQAFELNGELFDFGYLEDLHSEFADDEDFIVALKGEGTKEIKWHSLIKSDDKGELYSQLQTWPTLTPFTQNLFGQDFQFLSAERWGPRITTPLNRDNVARTYLGKHGEFLVSVLEAFEHKQLPNKNLPIHPQTTSRDVHTQISAWLNEISPGSTFNIKAIKEADSGITTFSYRSKLGKSRAFRPTNVGFGLSYTLPILTALMTAPQNALIIMENPEAHLHPKAQMVLGKLLGICANAGVQLIVESHSDHVLNGIRIAVKENLLSKEDVALHFINRADYLDIASTEVITPTMLKGGKLSAWPAGFFDEWDNALDQLL
ncbi:MAG: putative ATPase [Phenylobacterium sp.]|jgi:predicted ATPase